MRLTIAALGWSFDLSLEPAADEVEDDGAALNGGTTSAYPISFTAAFDMPDEAAIHRPVSPWEDDSGA